MLPLLRPASAVLIALAIVAGCGDEGDPSGPGSSGAGGGPSCGNGVIDPGEQCDDGDTDDTNGCTRACERNCSDADVAPCDDEDPCTYDACDYELAVCSHDPDDGVPCSSAPGPGICIGGMCIPSVCGDGIHQPGEECDLGADNGRGTGCETSCVWSCHEDAECDDGDACNGTQACAIAAGGMACAGGEPLADGSPCGGGGYCLGQRCTQPDCGDGVIEPGETCDPPSGPCNASCQLVVCGDGALVLPEEECDDANLLPLDGCDASCRYEVAVRWTAAAIHKGAAPPYCVHPGNQLGEAYAQEVLDAINQELSASIEAGASNDVMTFGGLDDPTGSDDAAFELGIASASLDPSHPAMFSSGALDHWFLAHPGQIDASGKPISALPAALSSRSLIAGPADAQLYVYIGQLLTGLELRDLMFGAMIDDPPAPSAPAPPPSQLDPALLVFESLSASQQGLGFCGALTVQALAQIPVVEQLTTGGAVPCSSSCSDSKSYVYCGAQQPVGPGCNSMLDVMVGGCKISALCVAGVEPTQPDVGSDGNPPAVLSADAQGKVVPTVATDAYTIHFRVDAKRAHVTNNL